MERTAAHVLSWPAIVFIVFFDRLSYLVCTYDFYIFVLVCIFEYSCCMLHLKLVRLTCEIIIGDVDVSAL